MLEKPAGHELEDATPKLFVATSIPSTPRKKLITLVEVLPHDELKVSLGVYSQANPPVGFSIEYEPKAEDGINAELITVHGAQKPMYELKVFLVDHGSVAVTAKIWELQEKP